MKNTKIKLTALILAGILAAFPLAGCSKADDTTQNQPPITENQQINTENNTAEDKNANTDSAAVYQVQIEYYEKLVADLEERLLNEKEENFIEISEYKQMIKDLEGSIAALSDKIAALEVSKNPPTSDNTLQNKPGTPNDNVNDKSDSDNATTNQTSKPGNVTEVGKDDQNSSNPENNATPPQNTNETFSYEIKNGKVTVTAYNGADKTVTVPETFEGLPVTAIGEGAFRDSKVEKVILPETVTNIDWFAFSGCKKLCEITIPSSVTSVGYGAFDNCSGFLVIKCSEGSYIEAYAASWGILSVKN